MALVCGIFRIIMSMSYKFLGYFFAFMFSLLALFSAGVLDSADGFQYLAVARNIYYTGEPTAPVYEYDTRQNIHMNTAIALNGKTYSFTGLGYSLSYLPSVAVADVVYKLYGVTAPTHFPLGNDWVIFLMAGFTNAFWGAVLSVAFVVFFLSLGLSKRQAILISLVAIFSTNLFVYTKHSMPHMMFTALLMLSFLMVKLYSVRKKRIFLVLAGGFYGLLSITYNQTFMLPIIPLVFYYFLLVRPKLNIASLKNVLSDGLFVAAGFVPFSLVYFWFENLRATSWQSFASASFYSSYVSHQLKFPVSVILEGLHGQLFSLGRSVFVYSSLLVLVVIYWFKIKRSFRSEFFTFLLLALIYVGFYATQYTPGQADQGIEGVWHGESSWGPRYLTSVVAMGMVVVGCIYSVLSTKAKIFIFLPLALVGVYVQLLGVLMPYQIKLHELQGKFFLNGTEYNSAKYSNFLPRYMPIFMMSKKLMKLAIAFPKSFDRGVYDVRFWDGMDFPFNVGGERWRVVEGRGYVRFDNLKKDPVRKFTFGVINHPLAQSSESASLRFVLNDTGLESENILSVGERKLVDVEVPQVLLRDKDNELVMEVAFDDPSVGLSKQQILGVISAQVNDKPINLESMDAPYVSSLGKAMGYEYKNWGGENLDPWKAWEVHTQMYERLPDIWWIRNLYYWDIPKGWIVSLLLLNLAVLSYSAIKLYGLLHEDKRRAR